jgi:hypothetical protein
VSGETEGAPFGWTLDSLKAHLTRQLELQHEARLAEVALVERLLDERDRRYEQRWASQEDAVRLALVGVNKEMVERMRQVREETQAAMLASDKAISKAEVATEKRFEAVTRGANLLQEQAGQFSQRREVDAIASSLSEKVFAIGSRLDTCVTRDEVLRQAEANAAAIDGFRAQALARWDANTPRITALSDDVVALKAGHSRIGSLEELIRSVKERADAAAPRSELAQVAEAAKIASSAEGKASTTRYDSAISRLATLAEDIVSLKVATARIGALEELVRAQKERLDKTEGHSSGGQAAWGWIAAGVSLIIMVIAVANALTNVR